MQTTDETTRSLMLEAWQNELINLADQYKSLEMDKKRVYESWLKCENNKQRAEYDTHLKEYETQKGLMKIKYFKIKAKLETIENEIENAQRQE